MKIYKEKRIIVNMYVHKHIISIKKFRGLMKIQNNSICEFLLSWHILLLLNSQLL